MPRDSFAWTLYNIEPADDAFRNAGEEVQREGWRYVADHGVDLFHRRCNAGLDRHGRPLAAIAESTRRRGPKRSHTGLGTATNPPLVPALGLSRAEDLLRGRGFADHAEWYWTTDPVTGLHWGQVMHWHRIGAGRLPVRDVIGWSEKDIQELRRAFAEWWYRYQNGAALAQRVKRLGLPHPLTTGPIAPPKFQVTGETDLDQFTFGIGGTKERAERALAEGYHSGFTRRVKGMPTVTNMPRPPGAPPAPPAPPPPPPWTPRPAAEFTTFPSPQAMDEFGERSFGEWARGLSTREQYALDAYTRHNYKWMNARLRGQPLTGDTALPPGMTLEQADRHVAVVTAAVERARTDRGIVTYRGVKDYRTMGIASLDKLRVGDSIPIESFGSTTLNPAKAEEFAGHGTGRVFFQMNHPEGSTGAYLNAAGVSSVVNEDEFLVPPDAEFRVVGRGPDRRDEVGTTWPVVILERIK